MIKKFSKAITRCQISNSKNLESLIFLGFLPPVNTLRKIGSTLEEEISFPAELLYCNKSKLAQLGCIVDKEILFPYTYPYTSSTTKILRENRRDKLQFPEYIGNIRCVLYYVHIYHPYFVIGLLDPIECAPILQ